MLGNQNWIEGMLRGDDRRKINWIPIGDRSRLGVQTGVTEELKWVVETSDGLAELSAGKPLIPAIRILELSPHELKNLLDQALADCGLNTHLTQTFPIESIILYSLDCGEFWIRHALDWLESAEIRLQSPDSVKQKIASFQTDRSISQELRHRAKRVAARLSNCTTN